MCSIFGSFSKDEISSLKALNSYRGQLTHSYSFISQSDIFVFRGKGPLYIPEYQEGYILCHQQAPTTQDNTSIHPSYYKGTYLWHNGIIKSKYIKIMQNELNDYSMWDTHLMHKNLIDKGIESLYNIIGSFSCVLYIDNGLYMFRNHIAPMFYCDNGTVSSTQFNGSIRTNPCTVYKLDFTSKCWVVNDKFDNVENPFLI